MFRGQSDRMGLRTKERIGKILNDEPNSPQPRRMAELRGSELGDPDAKAISTRVVLSQQAFCRKRLANVKDAAFGSPEPPRQVGQRHPCLRERHRIQERNSPHNGWHSAMGQNVCAPAVGFRFQGAPPSKLDREPAASCAGKVIGRLQFSKCMGLVTSDSIPGASKPSRRQCFAKQLETDCGKR